MIRTNAEEGTARGKQSGHAQFSSSFKASPFGAKSL